MAVNTYAPTSTRDSRQSKTGASRVTSPAGKLLVSSRRFAILRCIVVPSPIRWERARVRGLMKLGIINSAFQQVGIDTAAGLQHIARIGFDCVDVFTEA